MVGYRIDRQIADLGVLGQVVDAIDPLGSDIGRLRADKLVKKRA